MRPAVTVTVVLPAETAITTDHHTPPEPAELFRRRACLKTTMNERIVCLDIGDVRIGVAVSDPTGTIASPVEVIHRIGWGPDTRKIREICDRYQTDRVLSGLPLNMDGSEGFQAHKVRSFCAQLQNAGLQVSYQDERLSTVSAEEALIEGGISRGGRKQVVDKVAASVILQQWLDEQKHKGGYSHE